MLEVVPYGAQNRGLIFYFILFQMKTMQTLVKNNGRGGQSRKDAISVENESITGTFISLVT